MAYIKDENTIDKFIAKYPGVITEEIKGENIKYALEGYLIPCNLSIL